MISPRRRADPRRLARASLHRILEKLFDAKQAEENDDDRHSFGYQCVSTTTIVKSQDCSTRVCCLSIFSYCTGSSFENPSHGAGSGSIVAIRRFDVALLPQNEWLRCCILIIQAPVSSTPKVGSNAYDECYFFFGQQWRRSTSKGSRGH